MASGNPVLEIQLRLKDLLTKGAKDASKAIELLDHSTAQAAKSKKELERQATHAAAAEAAAARAAQADAAAQRAAAAADRERAATLRRVGFALAALAAGAVALTANFVGAASSFEQSSLRINILERDAGKAADTLERARQVALETPYAFEQIAHAAGTYRATLADTPQEIEHLLRLTADLATVSGLSFEATQVNLTRAFSAGIGAADLFRERGVKSMLGFKEGVQYTGEQTKEQILRMYTDAEKGFEGASNRMADTWSGTMSMLGDLWFNFRNEVLNADNFGAMTDSAKSLLESLRYVVETYAPEMVQAGAAIAVAFQAVIDVTVGAAVAAGELAHAYRLAVDGAQEFFSIVGTGGTGGPGAQSPAGLEAGRAAREVREFNEELAREAPAWARVAAAAFTERVVNDPAFVAQRNVLAFQDRLRDNRAVAPLEDLPPALAGLSGMNAFERLEREEAIAAAIKAQADAEREAARAALERQRAEEKVAQELERQREALAKTNLLAHTMGALADAGGAFRTTMADAFVSIIDGSKSAGEALRDFGQAFIRSLVQISAQLLATIALALVLNALVGFVPASAGIANAIATAQQIQGITAALGAAGAAGANTGSSTGPAPTGFGATSPVAASPKVRGGGGGTTLVFNGPYIESADFIDNENLDQRLIDREPTLAKIMTDSVSSRPSVARAFNA